MRAKRPESRLAGLLTVVLNSAWSGLRPQGRATQLRRASMPITVVAKTLTRNCHLHYLLEWGGLASLDPSSIMLHPVAVWLINVRPSWGPPKLSSQHVDKGRAEELNSSILVSLSKSLNIFTEDHSGFPLLIPDLRLDYFYIPFRYHDRPYTVQSRSLSQSSNPSVGKERRPPRQPPRHKHETYANANDSIRSSFILYLF